MKEIDFLPKWYKSKKRRRSLFRSQYIALGCMLGVILLWNILAGRSLSKVSAEIVEQEPKRAAAEEISHRFNTVTKEISLLRERVDILEEVDPRINIASVFAELSFLIDRSIVLSDLELSAEKIVDFIDGDLKSSFIRSGQKNQNSIPLGKVRFKVTISGAAVDASDVAEFICKLEDSPYFCNIIPSFSRNKKVEGMNNLTGNKSHLNEFRIGCYLANYQQQKPEFVKDLKEKL